MEIKLTWPNWFNKRKREGLPVSLNLYNQYLKCDNEGKFIIIQFTKPNSYQLSVIKREYPELDESDCYICQVHSIMFTSNPMQFDSIEDAKIHIDRNAGSLMMIVAEYDEFNSEALIRNPEKAVSVVLTKEQIQKLKR